MYIIPKTAAIDFFNCGVYVPNHTPQEQFIEEVKKAVIKDIKSTPVGEWPRMWYGLSGDRDFLEYIDKCTKKN